MEWNLLLPQIILISALSILIVFLVRKIKKQKTEIATLLVSKVVNEITIDFLKDVLEIKLRIDNFADKDIDKNDISDKKHRGVAKRVAQYSEFGKFINNYNSMRSAEKETKVSRANIKKSCNNNVAVKGFKFKFIK